MLAQAPSRVKRKVASSEAGQVSVGFAVRKCYQPRLPIGWLCWNLTYAAPEGAQAWRWSLPSTPPPQFAQERRTADPGCVLGYPVAVPLCGTRLRVYRVCSHTTHSSL